MGANDILLKECEEQLQARSPSMDVTRAVQSDSKLEDDGGNDSTIAVVALIPRPGCVALTDECFMRTATTIQASTNSFSCGELSEYVPRCP